MSGRLNRYVTVHGPDGRSHHFGPADVVPDWAVDRITFPGVWADSPDTGATGAPVDTPPVDDTDSDDNADAGETSPERPAQNATKAVWEAYADSLGLDVVGLKKADIIAAVDALDS